MKSFYFQLLDFLSLKVKVFKNNYDEPNEHKHVEKCPMNNNLNVIKSNSDQNCFGTIANVMLNQTMVTVFP